MAHRGEEVNYSYMPSCVYTDLGDVCMGRGATPLLLARDGRLLAINDHQGLTMWELPAARDAGHARILWRRPDLRDLAFMDFDLHGHIVVGAESGLVESIVAATGTPRQLGEDVRAPLMEGCVAREHGLVFAITSYGEVVVFRHDGDSGTYKKVGELALPVLLGAHVASVACEERGECWVGITRAGGGPVSLLRVGVVDGTVTELQRVKHPGLGLYALTSALIRTPDGGCVFVGDDRAQAFAPAPDGQGLVGVGDLEELAVARLLYPRGLLYVTNCGPSWQPASSDPPE